MASRILTGAAAALAAAPVTVLGAPVASATAPSQAEVALAGYTITRVTVPMKPPQGSNGGAVQEHNTSRNISKFAIPQLKHEALESNASRVHTVSGATFTSHSFRKSLQGAIALLQQSPDATQATGPAVVVKPPRSACPSNCPHYGKIRVHIVASR